MGSKLGDFFWFLVAAFSGFLIGQADPKKANEVKVEGYRCERIELE